MEGQAGDAALAIGGYAVPLADGRVGQPAVVVRPVGAAGGVVEGNQRIFIQGGQNIDGRFVRNPAAPGIDVVAKPVEGGILNRSVGVGVLPSNYIPQMNIDIEVPLFQEFHHLGRLLRQAGIYPNQDGIFFVGASPGGAPALFAVLGFFQAHQVQQQGGCIGAPLVAEPGNPLFVGVVEVGIEDCFAVGIDDVDMVRQAIPFDLIVVDFCAIPADNAGYQACLTAGFGGCEQSLVLLLFQVFHTIQFRILLL